MTDEKLGGLMPERTITMDELKEKVALLECKIIQNCPYPDRVEALEQERDTLKKKADKWDSMGEIDKKLIQLFTEHGKEAITILNMVPEAELRKKLFDAWYGANVDAGGVVLGSFQSEVDKYKQRAESAEDKFAEVAGIAGVYKARLEKVQELPMLIAEAIADKGTRCFCQSWGGSVRCDDINDLANDIIKPIIKEALEGNETDLSYRGQLRSKGLDDEDISDLKREGEANQRSDE